MMIHWQTQLEGFFVIQFFCHLEEMVRRSKSIWACAVPVLGAGQSSFPWLCVCSMWTLVTVGFFLSLDSLCPWEGSIVSLLCWKINQFFIAGSQLTVEVTVAGSFEALYTRKPQQSGAGGSEHHSGAHLSQGLLPCQVPTLCQTLWAFEWWRWCFYLLFCVYLFIVSKRVREKNFYVFSTFKPCLSDQPPILIVHSGLYKKLHTTVQSISFDKVHQQL